MKKYIIPLAIGGGLLAVIALWFVTSAGSKEANDIFIQPKHGTFRVTVTTTGELQAKHSIEVQGPSNARTVQVWQMKIANLIAEGTVVKTGQFVADLDKSEIMGKVKEAELGIQKAQSQYTQTKLDSTLTLTTARDELTNMQYALEEKKLLKEQSVYEAPSVKRQAEIDYEKAERAFAQAKINYKTKVQQSVAKMREVETDLAKEQQKMNLLTGILQEFTIKAPADGMVIYAKEWNGRKKVVGSTVSAWDPVVATLPDLSVMESVTYVNEVDIQKVKKGQSVKITLDADPNKKLYGMVTDVANIGEQRPNSDSKVFEVKILISTKDTTLRPAMTTANEIVTTTATNAIYVPLESIHTENAQSFVYKKSGSKIIKQQVEVGLMNENEAIIERGLAKSDRICLTLPPDTQKPDIALLPKKIQNGKSKSSDNATKGSAQ